MNDQGEKRKFTLSGPGVLPVPEEVERNKVRTSELLKRLEEARYHPNRRDAVLNEIIQFGDVSALANAVDLAADYPNGIGLLVESLIKKIKSQSQNQELVKTGALVHLVEHSVPVKKFPKALYLLVRAIILYGNNKAIERIGALDHIKAVTVLDEAVKSRDAKGIEEALLSFRSA